MKKLVFIIPLALILAGCSLGSTTSTPITGTEEQKAEKIAQIMSSGGQADCKITNLTDQTSTQMLISGKKIKITGSEMGDGKEGTMLSDSVYTYYWVDGEKTGFKSKIPTEVSPTPTNDSTDRYKSQSDPTAQAQSYGDETKFQTDCSRRSIADSEFVPPADVEFTDYSEMMKNIPAMPSGMPQ